MTHFLTPAKIGLLVLLELYTEETLPTEAVIPILGFITSHLMDADLSHTPPAASASARFANPLSTGSLVLSVAGFRTLLEPYQSMHGMPGRRVWDSFVLRLWHLSSLNALHEFLAGLSGTLLARSRDELRRVLGTDDEATIEKALAEVRFARSSRFGLFVRACMAEFEAARFHQVADLWRAFARYRQDTAEYLRKKVAALDEYSFDHVLLAGQQEDWGIEGVKTLEGIVYEDVSGGKDVHAGKVSMDDIDKLLEFQIERMQKYNVRVPLELRTRFQSLLASSLLSPAASHYVTFLDAWRAGDHANAVDALHRYFDYSLQEREQQQKLVQYALMNLAVVQAEFGCRAEAVSAMLETVATARENRDLTCLNFALNWLFHFGRAHPRFLRRIEGAGSGSGGGGGGTGTERETLAFLRVKAKEAGMWTLWAAVFLTDAGCSLSRGESVAAAWENVARGSHVVVERNLPSMFAPQMLLAAALWDRLGQGALASSTFRVFLGAHAAQSLFDDEVKVACRLAGSLASRGRYDEALATIEERKPLSKEEEEDDMYASAVRGPGLDAGSLRNWRVRQYLLKYRAVIRLRRDLAHGNLAGAEDYLAQLLQSKHDDFEPELEATVDSLRIELLIRRGDLSRAFALVEARLSCSSPGDESTTGINNTGVGKGEADNDDIRDHDHDEVKEVEREEDDEGQERDHDMMSSSNPADDDVALQVRHLILRAQLYAAAQRPQRGFTAALRAASLAHRARLLPLLWQAVGVALGGAVLVSLAEFAAAADVLEAVIPRALECDAVALQASLYLCLADAHMGLAGEEQPTTGSGGGAGFGALTTTTAAAAAAAGSVSGARRTRREHVAVAVAALDDAFAAYSALEDRVKMREAVAKKAVALKVVGEVDLAAVEAARYAALVKAEADGE